MFFLVLFLIFIVLPIAEIYVIIQVGETIGVWWTLAILIADSILGALLAARPGPRRVAPLQRDARRPGGRPRARCSTAA